MSEQSQDTIDCAHLQCEPILSDERLAELAPKLDALMAELIKIRELESPDSEPATPWPWGGADNGG
jgi:hypothetical protein